MSVYPNRDICFAHKFSRIIMESGVACDIGMEAVCLCMHIAHLEDAKKYTAPVKEWNSRLCQIFGITDNKLRKLRDRCVESGWLHYERGNSRMVGTYWVKIPSEFSSGFAPEPNLQEAAEKIVSQQISSNPEGNTGGSSGGNAVGDSGGSPGGDSGGPSSLSLSRTLTPSSCPGKSPDDKRRKYKFEEEDTKLAEWIWKKIVVIQPGRTPPVFDAWANTIRLMRERDKRTHRQIAQLFAWANRDNFWQTNILSPEKLREKWDDLSLKRQKEESKPPDKQKTDIDEEYPKFSKRPE